MKSLLMKDAIFNLFMNYYNHQVLVEDDEDIPKYKEGEVRLNEA